MGWKLSEVNHHYITYLYWGHSVIRNELYQDPPTVDVMMTHNKNWIIENIREFMGLHIRGHPEVEYHFLEKG